jgi:glycosyltransferase involved in cell wall biosynthesis
VSTDAHDPELLDRPSGYAAGPDRSRGDGDPPLRVAYVAYFFPPLGGAGTQRSLKTVVHLPAFGFDPIVVTGPGHSSSRWTPPDESLAAELPPDMPVLRVPGPEPPYGSRKWRAWWQKGVANALRSVDVDVIHVSMSPFSSAEPTARIAAERGIPFVAGLRDPWALDEMMAYPTRFHRSLEARRMHRALSAAAWIVMNTPEAVARTRKAFPELADRIAVSTNGYDSADFAEQLPNGDARKFRIAHTGYLHTEDVNRTMRRRIRRLLGGEILDVDVSTRSHLYLVEALRRLVEAEPRLRDVIELDLAGVVSPEDPQAAADLEFVHFLGYLPHAESVALIQQADLLFLPMHKIRQGARAGIVPGKTFEYMATGKPILAAVPAGDARDFVQAAGTGLVCDPDDVDAMVRIIRGEIERWETGAPSPAVDAGYVSRFERRVLTQDLAGVLRRAVSRNAAAPLTVRAS